MESKKSTVYLIGLIALVIGLSGCVDSDFEDLTPEQQRSLTECAERIEVTLDKEGYLVDETPELTVTVFDSKGKPFPEKYFQIERILDTVPIYYEIEGTDNSGVYKEQFELSDSGYYEINVDIFEEQCPAEITSNVKFIAVISLQDLVGSGTESEDETTKPIDETQTPSDDTTKPSDETVIPSDDSKPLTKDQITLPPDSPLKVFEIVNPKYSENGLIPLFPE